MGWNQRGMGEVFSLSLLSTLDLNFDFVYLQSKIFLYGFEITLSDQLFEIQNILILLDRSDLNRKTTDRIP